mgnify:FL=1
MKHVLFSTALIALTAFALSSYRYTPVEADASSSEIVVLTQTDKNSDKVVIYHRGYKALFVYGRASADKDGIQLLQMRKVDTDFALAGKLQSLNYRQAGYSTKIVKDILGQ